MATSRSIVVQLLVLCAAASFSSAQASLQSQDGYIRRSGNEWILGTRLVERRVRLAEGRFLLTSLRNKVSGHECQDGNSPPDEIRFLANGQDVSASGWRWKLRSEQARQLAQGELQLDLELESSGLRVAKHYVIYPGASVIREWLTLDNASDKPVHLSQVDFLHSRVLVTVPQDLELNYLTGGGNYNGSQLLKTEAMSAVYRRTFDSNGGVQAGAYSSFLPLIFLHNRTTNEGVALGWDYMGHWRFDIGDRNGSPL